MEKASFHILRVGTGITFLWIGILILRDPVAWSGMLLWWARDLLNMFSISPAEALVAAAFLDIAVGFFLLIDVFSWAVALMGVLHLLIVLVTVGINVITIRDIGLLAATFALFLDSCPEKYRFWSPPKHIPLVQREFKKD